MSWLLSRRLSGSEGLAMILASEEDICSNEIKTPCAQGVFLKRNFWQGSLLLPGLATFGTHAEYSHRLVTTSGLFGVDDNTIGGTVFACFDSFDTTVLF